MIITECHNTHSTRATTIHTAELFRVSDAHDTNFRFLASSSNSTISSRAGIAASTCNTDLRLHHLRTLACCSIRFLAQIKIRTVSLAYSHYGGCRLRSPTRTTRLVHGGSCHSTLLLQSPYIDELTCHSPTAVAGRIRLDEQSYCYVFNPSNDRLMLAVLRLLSSGEAYYTHDYPIRQHIFQK